MKLFKMENHPLKNTGVLLLLIAIVIVVILSSRSRATVKIGDETIKLGVDNLSTLIDKGYTLKFDQGKDLDYKLPARTYFLDSKIRVFKDGEKVFSCTLVNVMDKALPFKECKIKNVFFAADEIKAPIMLKNQEISLKTLSECRERFGSKPGYTEEEYKNLKKVGVTWNQGSYKFSLVYDSNGDFSHCSIGVKVKDKNR